MDDKKNKTVVHPCNRMLLTYCAKIKPWKDIFQMHITKWNKSIWKNYILYDSKYMTLWKFTETAKLQS